jgi:hypothetical protein
LPGGSAPAGRLKPDRCGISRQRPPDDASLARNIEFIAPHGAQFSRGLKS